MRDYRFFAGAPGELVAVPIADACGGDRDAFMVATRLATETMQAEVWQGARFVCRVPAKRRQTVRQKQEPDIR